jgi:hypothetical protein
VNGSIHVGQSEDDVVSQFGEPSSRGPLDGGMQALDYVVPTPKAPTDSSAYAGFTVYLKDGKVVDMTIIRGSDLRK